MKKIQIAGLTALTLLGTITSSLAQEASTGIVGYVTETITAGKLNLIGITLHDADIVNGTFEAATDSGIAILPLDNGYGNRTDLTDTDIDFGSLLVADTTYILEITSGDASGVIQEIISTDVSSNSITTPDDLTNIGTGKNIAAGASYKIRKSATISSIFGASNSAGLLPGIDTGTADVVWVQNGEGGFNKYFYHPGGGFPLPVPAGWKNSVNQDASSTPLIYTDGLMIETNNTLSNTLTLTGSVIDSSKNIELIEGFNLLGTVYPVGTTLADSQLETQILQGIDTSTADVIWVQNGADGFNKFFYHPGGGFPLPVPAGWKNSVNQDASSQVIAGAIFLERQSGFGTITTIPSF